MRDVELLPLDRAELIELAAGWLAQKENYQWLDFGDGRRIMTPALLKIMTQRPTHFLRLYTSPRDGTPIGLCGLNNVDRVNSTATFWGLAGDKSFRNRGYGTLGARTFLSLVFRELGLHSINTWVVEHNPSLRIGERLHYHYVGRQRQCHMIDGRLYDRLLFDLLASEHRAHNESRIEHGEPGSSLTGGLDRGLAQHGLLTLGLQSSTLRK
ncbi:MAG: GNAT family N-acetyltransferase [Burkholderiales bacterium]